MTERQLRLRLGIFAVLALVLLAALIVLFGSAPTLFKRTNEYTIIFKDAPGLRPGSPIHRSGVRIGEVKEVKLNDAKEQVEVVTEVEKTYTVRHSEQPTLIITLLGNDASIDFLPKKLPPNEELDRSPIPPGSEIQGATQVSVNTLISRATDVVPTTQEALNDMRNSLRKLTELEPLLRDTLVQYRDLGKSANREFPDVVKSLRTSSDDVGAAAREYRRLGENLNVLLQANEDKFVKALDNANIVLERVVALLSDGNLKSITAIIQYIRDASEHAPAIAKNIRDASDRAPAIAKNIQEASEHAPAIAKSLHEVMDRAPAIAKNVQEATDEAPAIAKNTRAASEHFPAIAKNADELAKEARVTLARLDQTLIKADAALTDVQKATNLLGERGPAVAKNLDESLEKLNRSMTDVRELLRVVGQSDGTLNRILTDPSLYNNLDQSVCGIAKLLPRLDRILKDMETFADKLARHPELIGAGGVLKGSDGLKDTPKIGVPVPR